MSADSILFYAFVVAVALVAVRWLTIAPLVSLAWYVPGEAKFDAKNSWISNTTLLGTVLVAAVKDFKESGAPVDIGNLNILFLALAALSLLVAMATVRLFSPNSYGTRVRMYLVSGTIGLWAAAGQILTLGYIIYRAPAAAISGPAATVFLGALVIGALALGGYAWIIMRQQIKSAVAAPPAAEFAAAPDWPLL